jgi:hypothetical protein
LQSDGGPYIPGSQFGPHFVAVIDFRFVGKAINTIANPIEQHSQLTTRA